MGLGHREAQQHALPALRWKARKAGEEGVVSWPTQGNARLSTKTACIIL